MKNIQENQNVALLTDEYNEDWTRLYFIMIQGKVSILGGQKLEKHELLLLEKAHNLPIDKCAQYQKIGIGELL